jgi:hypothetical protein
MNCGGRLAGMVFPFPQKIIAKDKGIFKKSAFWHRFFGGTRCENSHGRKPSFDMPAAGIDGPGEKPLTGMIIRVFFKGIFFVKTRDFCYNYLCRKCLAGYVLILPP